MGDSSARPGADRRRPLPRRPGLAGPLDEDPRLAEALRYSTAVARHWAHTHNNIIDRDEAGSIAGEVVAVWLPKWHPSAGLSLLNFLGNHVRWALVDAVRHRLGRHEHQRRTFEILGDYDEPVADADETPVHSFLDTLPPVYRLIVEGIAAGATREHLAERLGTNVATTQRMVRHIRSLYAEWDALPPGDTTA